MHIAVSAVHVRVRVDHEDGRPVEYYEEDLTEDGTIQDFKTLFQMKTIENTIFTVKFYILVYIV